MFNFLKKKQPEIVTKKSLSIRQAFRDELSFDDNRILRPKKALFYYDVVSPVATAIDLVNDEFKNLTIAVEKNRKKTLDHPVLTFLKQPNDDMVQIDFLENLGMFYLVTNEVYIIATGRPNRKPAELMIVSPEIITIKTDTNGFIFAIEMRRNHTSKIVFKRDEKEFRFFNEDGSAEIWQIKGFSSSQTFKGFGSGQASGGSTNGQTFRGQSKLSSVSYEVEQYLQCAIHNLGLLRNGVRSTGAFKMDGALTDEQFDRLKNQIHETKAGSANAGKSIILEGGLDYIEMSMTPKDMDFEKLKQGTEKAVFKRYKIPLALVTTEQMAESTMEISQLMLYDNAVLPLARRLLAELTRFLAPRFNLADDEKIVPFMEDITALQIRRIKETKNKKETGVFTTDEIRETLGDDPLPDEKGKVLYIPANLVPIGEEKTQPIGVGDPDGTGDQGIDNRPKPGDDDMESDTPTDNERVKTTREGFAAILKQQVDKQGNRTYTDADIDRMADEEGL